MSGRGVWPPTLPLSPCPEWDRVPGRGWRGQEAAATPLTTPKSSSEEAERGTHLQRRARVGPGVTWLGAAVGHLLTPGQPPRQSPGPVNEEGQIAAPFQSGLSPRCPLPPGLHTCPPPPRTGPVLSRCDCDSPAHKQQNETPAVAALAAETHAWGQSRTWLSPGTRAPSPSLSPTSPWPEYGVRTRFTSPVLATQATAKRDPHASRTTRAHRHTHARTHTRCLAGR